MKDLKATIFGLCFLVLGTMMVLIVASCTDATETMSDSSQRRISLVASSDAYTPLASTRTEVGEVGSDGSLSILWSAGDCIGVFSTGTANAQFVNGNETAGTTATFTGEIAGVPQYAYYPYSAEVTTPNAIAVEIPAEQTYLDENSIAKYDIKAAEIVSQGDGYGLNFRQMAALVRFEFDLTGVSTLSPDELLKDVTIRQTETSVPMAGEFTYDLTNLDAGLTAGNFSMDGITLYFEEPKPVSGVIVAYAVVAPGAHTDNEWCCVFATDRHIVTFTTTALCDFEAGKYYTVPLNFEVLDRNDAQYEEIPQPDPEEETANCYIVTEPGTYSFNATVIGNGEKGIIKGAGFHTEDPYIDPKSVKVLWQDTRDFLTDVTLRDGRVYYTVVGSSTGSTAGNAVVAVYSEPDCQGEILWSWHIWGTIGEPVDEEYTNQAGAKFMVLDRELGAVRVGQNGCLYQWGRKDPFPGCHSGSFIYNDEYTSKSVSNTYPYLIENDNATILDAVRNPQYLISGTGYTNLNWLAEANYYLWGDADRYLPGVLTDPSAGAGWNQQKTIYDPSPVGYRVANIFTFSGFTKCPSGTNGDVDNTHKLDSLNYVKATTGTYNWYFKKNADDTEGVVYQAIRSRDGMEGYRKKNAGYGGYWWSAEAYDNGGKATACYLNTDKFDGEGYNSNYHVIKTYARGTYLRDAYAIRCVREE